MRELDLPNVPTLHQICLPSGKLKGELKSCHEEVTAGQFGQRKTHQKVKRHFLCKKVSSDVCAELRHMCSLQD